MPDTYLMDCLKDGLTVRWPDSAMPIKVHIAPFRWYQSENQMEAGQYRQMVLNALKLWSDASGGMLRFQLVQQLLESQINVAWRRVDRKRLGHCEYHVNKNMVLFSAEVSIGISDGKVHADYADPREVQETIIHEFGHALGMIGHSDAKQDIMYPNRLYGTYEGISERDKITLQWLYRLPVSFDYKATGKQHGLKDDFEIDDVIAAISGEQPPSEGSFKKKLVDQKKAAQQNQEHVLQTHHDILTQRGKFWMMTQQIAVKDDVTQSLAMEQIHQKRKQLHLHRAAQTQSPSPNNPKPHAPSGNSATSKQPPQAPKAPQQPLPPKAPPS